jgi:hypothetical protein
VAQVNEAKKEASAAEKAKSGDKAAKAKKRAEEKAAADAAKAEAATAKAEAKAAVALAEVPMAATAAELVASGKTGAELVKAVAALGEGAMVAKILAAAVLAALPEPTSTEWCSEAASGAALKHLCKGKGSTQKQASIVYAVQAAYLKLGFPKVPGAAPVAPVAPVGKASSKEQAPKKDSLFEKVLFKLYESEVVEEAGFNEWRYATDDDDNEKDHPGKTDALFQISGFLKWLDEPPVENEEEEEDLPPAPVILKSK